MLSEFKQVKQEPGPGLRRWFEGGGLELIVWYDGAREPKGFQLCYQGNDHQERALTWRPDSGFSHARVDGGDSRPDKNMTPILARDGPVPWDQIQEQFARNSSGLEPALRYYVISALSAGAR